MKHAEKACWPPAASWPPTRQITQAAQLQTFVASGNWVMASTVEVMNRGWFIEGQSVRPDHRMVAHTGFLTSARFIPR